MRRIVHTRAIPPLTYPEFASILGHQPQLAVPCPGDFRFPRASFRQLVRR